MFLEFRVDRVDDGLFGGVLFDRSRVVWLQGLVANGTVVVFFSLDPVRNANFAKGVATVDDRGSKSKVAFANGASEELVQNGLVEVLQQFLVEGIEFGTVDVPESHSKE